MTTKTETTAPVSHRFIRPAREVGEVHVRLWIHDDELCPRGSNCGPACPARRTQGCSGRGSGQEGPGAEGRCEIRARRREAARSQGREVTTVIGYLRVSTREQSESGAGLAAQRSAIAAEAVRRGWEVIWIEDAGVSGKSLKRDGIREALRLLKRHEASALVVAKLDRLSRSVQDFAGLMSLAARQGWAVVALDLGVDMTTPAGKLVASVMSAVAEWERDVIAARTRDALAERKAAGVRLGRERMTDAATWDRIVVASRAGDSPSTIARALDTDQVPTPNGAVRWYPNTVRRILIRERGEEAA